MVVLCGARSYVQCAGEVPPCESFYQAWLIRLLHITRASTARIGCHCCAAMMTTVGGPYCLEIKDEPQLEFLEAMAHLVCSKDFSLVKGCEGKTCTLLFLDKTHARARRWCSMNICGNRAKQAANRQRSVGKSRSRLKQLKKVIH